MPHCAVNGARLHYERHGRGEPLLLITGFTISAAVFEPVLDRYARRFECIALRQSRLRAHAARRRGPPRWPSSPRTPPGCSTRSGSSSAHVYGVSMGGMVAQELALRFPERVRGLVLGGTTPGGPRAVRPDAKELAAPARAAVGGARSSGGPWLARRALLARVPRDHPEQRARAAAPTSARHPPTQLGALAQWWATVYHDTTSRLDQIRAPTLVLHGERDALAPLGERAPPRRAHPRRGAGRRARRGPRLRARAAGA